MENKTKMTPRTNARAVFPSCNDSNDTSHPQGTHVDADFARALERELATERARMDWLLLDVVSRFDDAYYTRAAIDAAMKEET